MSDRVTKIQDLPFLKSTDIMANHGQPLVTIGIPTFNRVDRLIHAINSARQQSYTSIEIVISDNFSSDGTEELCRNLAKEDGRIVYLRQSQNVGAVKNFQHALIAARGEFFMWLADDDQISTNYIKECLSILQSDLKLAMASGQAIFMLSECKQQKGISISALSSSRWLRVIKYLFLVRDNSGFYGLMRIKVARSFKIKNVLAGDWLWVMTLAFLGGLGIAQNATLIRSADGESADFDRLMRSNGYSRLQRMFPYLKIAFQIRAEIATSPPFKCSTKTYERVLGGFVAALTLVVGQCIFWKVISLLSYLLRKLGNNKIGYSLRSALRSWMGI